MGQLRAQDPPVPPGSIGSVFAALEARLASDARRAAGRDPRLAAASAGAAAAGATVALAVLVGRSRAARAARAC